MDSELVSGGYFLSRHFDRPDHVSAELMPDRLLSLSGCFAEFIPDMWAIPWTGVSEADRASGAAAFDLDATGREALMDWTEANLGEEFGWPNVFMSLGVARRFARRFLPDGAEAVLLGIALTREDAATLVDVGRPPTGWAPDGVYERISAGEPPATGGRRIGWEVLCYETGGFHTWLCNGLEAPVADRLGIGAGPAGLIESHQDAAAAAGYAGRDDVGAEPGLWQPWLVARYEV